MELFGIPKVILWYCRKSENETIFMRTPRKRRIHASFLLYKKVVSIIAKYTYWLTEEGLTLIEGWARDGLTEKQIAFNIGIRRETLHDWKRKYPNISNTLKKGKEVVDRQVENALFKSAVGFIYEEDVVTNAGDVVRVKKYSKPNTTAQIFWLKNRKREQWTDKSEVKVEGTIKTNKLDGILAQLGDD